MIIFGLVNRHWTFSLTAWQADRSNRSHALRPAASGSLHQGAQCQLGIAGVDLVQATTCALAR